jgi:hypothetical protein
VNNIKNKIHFDSQICVRAFLLFYTLFCVCLYDPVVKVDDTPRKPLFKEIIGHFSGVTLISTKEKQLKKEFKKLFSTFSVEREFVQSVLSSLILLNRDQLIFFNPLVFIQNSIKIRAPSI